MGIKYDRIKKKFWKRNDNKEFKVKKFNKIQTETDYVQSSCNVQSFDALGRKIYPIVKTETSVDMMSECKNILIRYGSKQNAIKAEDIVKGIVKEKDISLPLDWMLKEVQDRGLCYVLHSMAFLDSIYVEFENTGDIKYRELIKNYMIDWVKGNDIQLRENVWAWHDDATARRVFRMSYYYSLFKNSFIEKERQLIEKSLHEQAMLLMDENFYKSKHNHGMYQDFGLLVYTLLIVNDNEEKANNLQTLFARTGEYLRCVFTNDGVHKEHSPYYARDVFAEARRFIKIAKDICPTFAEDIGEVTKNTEHYLVQLIKPNGMWPSLGDSSESSMKNGMKMVEDISEYQYLISKGITGIRPKENMVFPQGGYAFMRSSWDDDAQEATWMMLLAATFSSTHKHGDDLSFLLYHKGDLFVEAGKRDYNYSNEQTAWVYSAYAHNVLLVNGEGFPVKVGKNGFQSIYPSALQTKILDYDMDGDVKWVKACQKRYENIVQERTVLYDKAGALVSVEDCITSEKDFEGTLLYHTAEDIKIVSIEHGWKLYREEELIASVLVRTEEKYTLNSIIGNEGESPYNTWIFGGKSEPNFGSLLKVDVSCHAGENKVVLDIFLK